MDGKIRICCNTDQKLNGLNFGYDRISDVWNCSEMNNIRKDMINGVKLSSCERCYFAENLGHRSARIDVNHQQIWRNVKIDDSPKILFLDFKLSIQCNLKCRMCNPYSSSLLEKEYNTSKNAEIQIPNSIDSNPSSKTWQQTGIFWENMEEVLPHLKKLKFTGGEPSIDKNVHKILERRRFSPTLECFHK